MREDNKEMRRRSQKASFHFGNDFRLYTYTFNKLKRDETFDVGTGLVDFNSCRIRKISELKNQGVLHTFL